MKAVKKAVPAKSVPAKAEEKVVEVNRNVPMHMVGVMFVRGASAYNPRAAHNIASWERMCVHLDKAKGKGVDGKVLAGELTINGKHPEKTHFDFISYLERRSALAIL